MQKLITIQQLFTYCDFCDAFENQKSDTVCIFCQDDICSKHAYRFITRHKFLKYMCPDCYKKIDELAKEYNKMADEIEKIDKRRHFAKLKITDEYKDNIEKIVRAAKNEK